MKKTTNLHGREATLNTLNQDFFDLIIIGGGVTGAGIALEQTNSMLYFLMLLISTKMSLV